MMFLCKEKPYISGYKKHWVPQGVLQSKCRYVCPSGHGTGEGGHGAGEGRLGAAHWPGPELKGCPCGCKKKSRQLNQVSNCLFIFRFKGEISMLGRLFSSVSAASIHVNAKVQIQASLGSERLLSSYVSARYL